MTIHPIVASTLLCVSVVKLSSCKMFLPISTDQGNFNGRLSIADVSVSTCAIICEKEALVSVFSYLEKERFCLIPDGTRIDLTNTTYNSGENKKVYAMNDRFDKGT